MSTKSIASILVVVEEEDDDDVYDNNSADDHETKEGSVSKRATRVESGGASSDTSVGLR